MDPHFLGGQKWGKKEPRDDNKEVDNGYDPSEGGGGDLRDSPKKKKNVHPTIARVGGCNYLFPAARKKVDGN